LLSKIIDHYGYTGEVLAKEARGADVLTHNASNTKVSELISYNLTPFDEGLATTLDWYKMKFKDSK
jgi:UDP-glucose 4-epimerase